MIDAITSICCALVLVIGLVGGIILDNKSKEKQLMLFTNLLRENKK